MPECDACSNLKKRRRALPVAVDTTALRHLLRERCRRDLLRRNVGATVRSAASRTVGDHRCPVCLGSRPAQIAQSSFSMRLAVNGARNGRDRTSALFPTLPVFPGSRLKAWLGGPARVCVMNQVGIGRFGWIDACPIARGTIKGKRGGYRKFPSTGGQRTFPVFTKTASLILEPSTSRPVGAKRNLPRRRNQ
jgi:hypothetical protein